MSSLFGIAANGASEFYQTKINQSLRFEDGSSSHLAFTPSSSNGRTKCTISAWVKRGNISKECVIFGAGTASTNRGHLRFNGDDTLEWAYYNGSWILDINTSAKFRDTTNWYHVVATLDTTDGTADIYVNGTLQTLQQSDKPSGSQDTAFGQNVEHHIGERNYGTSGYFDGYIAEVNFINGSDLNADSFGETKNGVWIPKAYGGSYGTNGFRLTFADSSSLGDDTSGNGNDFTAANLASTDVVLDSPTNNFCVINQVRENTVVNGSVTITEGNLQSVDGGTTYGLHWTATFEMTSGKWYWEVLAHTLGGSHGNIGITNSVQRGTTSGTGVFYGNDGKRNPHPSTAGNTTYGASYTNGDIIGIAFDADNETVTFYKNNSSQGAVGSVLTSANGGYFPAVGDAQNATTYKYVANFGQDSSFAGNKTAQGNADGNGNGDFYYSPPSGYLALCSANLSDTELSPDQLEQADDYFVVKTYSGDSNNNTQVSTGFQPDWVWIKSRNEGASAGSGEHMLYDTNRGVQKDLNTNDNGNEATNANGLQEFGTTFFRPGSLTRTNETGDTYVSWNWRVNGGTTSTDTNGSLTSTVQTNSKVGISIATFNKPSQANFSFGHGLGSVPEMFWWVARNQTMAWIVYHPAKAPSVPNQNGIYLNSSLAGFTSGGNWITGLTDTTVSITDGQVSSGGNIDYLCYSFKSVDGFSKIGSYAGNGNADGTFVYTGFRPAWVIGKSITSSGDNWFIFDNKRDVDNVVGADLNPDSFAAEATSSYMDFLSNGFKLRSTSGLVNDATTFVYMAFAEQPFKFSNAR